MPVYLRTESELARFLLLAVALLLSIAATQVHSRPLTDAKVEAVIATYKDMDTVFGGEQERLEDLLKNEVEDDLDDLNIDFTRVAAGLVEEVSKHPPTRAKLASVVQRHGFNDLDEWSAVADRIFLAHRAIQLEGHSFMTQSEIDQYMAQMEEFSMPEAEQTRMRNMFESTLAANQAAQSLPDEDIETVRRYVEELDNLHVDDDDETMADVY